MSAMIGAELHRGCDVNQRQDRAFGRCADPTTTRLSSDRILVEITQKSGLQ